MMQATDVIAIIDALETSGVVVWVYGGWGIDALLEEQTRPHDDLDLLIHEDDIESAISITHDLGFSLMTNELPQGFVVRDIDDRRIDFHPVSFQKDGSAIQRIRGGGKWVFSATGLHGIGKINGRKIRCITPEEQVIRASNQPGSAGYEPSEIDRRDIKLLKERFGITLPRPYDNIQ